MDLQSHDRPNVTEARRRAVLAWMACLNEAEEAAVVWYLMTGDTTFIDALRPTSPRLQAYVFRPWTGSVDALPARI
jgi:hypothetical protein